MLNKLISAKSIAYILFGFDFNISMHNSLPIEPPAPVTMIILFCICFFKTLLSTIILGLSIISKKLIFEFKEFSRNSFV